MRYVHAALLKFQGLQARERWLALLAAVVVITVLLDTAWLAPQRHTIGTLAQQLEQQKSEQEALSAVLSEAQAAAAPGANAATALSAETIDTTERDDLRLRLASAEAAQGPMLNDAHLSTLVRSLVTDRSDLALVSLKTLAPEEVKGPNSVLPTAPQSPPRAGDAKANASALYKHGVEVAVRGPYPALLAYMADLQQPQNRVFWAKVKLDVQTYPLAILVMTVYTVSDHLDATWAKP
jgi:MSHA biogenesis protein MshJ